MIKLLLLLLISSPLFGLTIGHVVESSQLSDMRFKCAATPISSSVLMTKIECLPRLGTGIITVEFKGQRLKLHKCKKMGNTQMIACKIISGSIPPSYAVFEGHQPLLPVSAVDIEIEIRNAFDPVRMVKLYPKTQDIPDQFKLMVGIPMMRAGKIVAFTNGGFNKEGGKRDGPLVGMAQLLTSSFHIDLETYKETHID